MSGSLLEVLRVLAALVLMGGAIKFMDDFLDMEYDRSQGEETLAARLGRATLPYAIVLVAVAASLSVKVSVAVFLGSYVVGMMSTWREHLPTRVPAYIEMVVAVLLSLALAGWRMTIWAIAMMAVIDWLDDMVDATRDEASGQRNLVTQLGRVEVAFLTLIALLTAVLLNAEYSALAFIAVLVVSLVFDFMVTHRHESVDEWGVGG